MFEEKLRELITKVDAIKGEINEASLVIEKKNAELSKVSGSLRDLLIEELQRKKITVKGEK